MAARASQVAVRTLTSGTPAVRVSQSTLRVMSEITRAVRASQVTVRMLSDNVADDEPESPGGGGMGLPPVIVFF